MVRDLAELATSLIREPQGRNPLPDPAPGVRRGAPRCFLSASFGSATKKMVGAERVSRYEIDILGEIHFVKEMVLTGNPVCTIVSTTMYVSGYHYINKRTIQQTNRKTTLRIWGLPRTTPGCQAGALRPSPDLYRDQYGDTCVGEIDRVSDHRPHPYRGFGNSYRPW
jgi:hypothetical protein